MLMPDCQRGSASERSWTGLYFCFVLAARGQQQIEDMRTSSCIAFSFFQPPPPGSTELTETEGPPLRAIYSEPQVVAHPPVPVPRGLAKSPASWKLIDSPPSSEHNLA